MHSQRDAHRNQPPRTATSHALARHQKSCASRMRSTLRVCAGVGGLYSGLSAGLLRQATYTTARLGIFKIINTEAIKYNDNKPIPLSWKALCGLTAGGLGALVGTPADLTLVRMQAGARCGEHGCSA